MKKMKLFSFALVLMLGTAMATSCSGRDPKKRSHAMVEKITNKLELDTDQASKLQELMKTVQEQKRSQREKYKTQEEGFKNLILSEKLDKDATKKLFETRQKELSEGFDPVFEKLQAFHASLTPDQKKEAVKYLAKFKKRFH